MREYEVGLDVGETIMFTYGCNLFFPLHHLGLGNE